MGPERKAQLVTDGQHLFTVPSCNSFVDDGSRYRQIDQLVPNMFREVGHDCHVFL